MKRLFTLAAGACALVLAACGDDPAPDQPAASGALLQSRAEGAPRAGTPQPDGFEYLRYAVSTDSATPQLCLTFSGALDPQTDYSAYVDVNEPVALSVEGSQLCIGGLNYGQTRELTLRAGLPAASGDTLEADVSTTLTFDDRPAFVGFSGSGIILPRIESDGLGIETVNVDAVEVRIQRVTDRALAFKELTDGFTAAPGEWTWTPDREEPAELGVEVYRGRMDTGGPANAAVTTVLPVAEALGRLQAGAYYVELFDAAALDREDREPGARAARWLIVTDLAFTAYRGETGIETIIRSLQTARPMAGVEVQLVARSNEILATRTTGADGRVHFPEALLTGEDGNRPRLLTAYGPSGDFALLDLQRAPVDLTDAPVDGRAPSGAADAYVYLDRGIYRPGETVQASALLRGPSGAALTGRAGALVVYQPNGLEFARHRFEAAPDAGGIVHAFDLPAGAARGGWRLTAELDGLGIVGEVGFQVEDFVPQRVALELEADTDTPMRAGETRMIEASARFLYGAPGAGLPMEGTARIQIDPSPFEGFGDYAFGLHDEQFGEELVDLPPVAADGAGAAQIPVTVGRRGAQASAPLRVRAVVRVQEPGGRAVADDVRIPYRPRDIYAGLKADFSGRAERKAPAEFSVIALNAAGEPMRGDLAWRLVRNDVDYDWYRTSGGEWRWRRTETVVPITQGVAALDGEAAARIVTPPLDWGDYDLIVADGTGTDLASRSFWVGWGGRSQDGETAPDQVRVAGPDAPVAVGEEAVVTVQAPYAGLADVVVATDRVLTLRQMTLSEEGAEVRLPVTRDWGQGTYVMVTVHTPRDPVDQPLPRRAVGVAYVPVNIEDRTIDLTLEAPELTEPNRTLQIPVTAEGAGDRIHMTLAAVDEGVLLLTRHQSPDPVDFIFGKERLGVDLLDDYGRVLDPNLGAAAALRSGGDQIGGAGLSVVPTRTVALFAGPVQLDNRGRGTINLELPDFNGELRLMAVAWSESALGAADQPMTVRDAVAAELILPRFLAPGDTAVATASLDNVDGPDGVYAASVTAEGPVSVAGASAEGPLTPGERRDGPVTLEAGGEGIAELALQLTGPDGFTAASAYPIEVRAPYLPETRVRGVILEPGETYAPPADLLSGYTPGSGLVQISVAPTPIDAAALFQSLYRYPYACSEQLVSRVTPLLYAGRLASLVDENGPDGAPAEVRAALETILGRQGQDGAFGLWRMGDGDASPWLGAYTTDFVSRAAAAGYPVPPAALERALAALQPVSQGELWRSGYEDTVGDPRWTEDTQERLADRSAAYALYVLARNGQADRSRLRYMHDERIDRIDSPLARAHIGAALAALGDEARAASAFEAAVEALGYVNDGDWYQTPRRDLAGVMALAAEAGRFEIVESLTPRLARDLPEPARLTTQEKAWLILAAEALAGDGETLAVTYDGEAGRRTVTLDDASLAEAAAFENTGDTPLFLTVLTRGAPAGPPPAVSEQLRLEKTITDTAGRPVNSTVSQGDRLVVALTLRPERAALSSYGIDDLLPAGFEIEAGLPPLDGVPHGAYAFLGELDTLQIAEARDDRFVAALEARREPNGNPVRLAYLVRAVTPGDFALPGAVAEDMYKPEVFARTGAGRVRVER
ncbi:MAG: alpha-2-macroglobulin family protein [Oceanicaulis sp.]